MDTKKIFQEDGYSIKKSFDENGFVVVSGLIKENLIDKAVSDLDERKNTNHRYFTQSTHTFVKFSELTDEGYLEESIQSPHKQFSAGPLRDSVKNIISDLAISDCLKSLSGGFESFVVWQSMLFDKSVGTVEHADTWYLDTNPKGLMIAVWIALEDIHEDAGRFFVVPKSNRFILGQNSTEAVPNHHDYAHFIKDYVDSNNLLRFAPALKKGDALFWHPNTIHGSFSQRDNTKSRKSITCHYHPVGIGRKHMRSKEDICRINRRLLSTSNKNIYLDNSDPSVLSFYWTSLFKFYLKRLLNPGKSQEVCLMNRDRIFDQ